MWSLRQMKFALRLMLNSSQRRYALRWLQSQEADFLLRHKLPWITFGAIDFLNDLNLAGQNVFEYGSGGSTLYWLNHGAKCVSIEHDEAWYTRLQTELQANWHKDYTLLDYRFITPSIHPNVFHFDAADPDDYSSDEYPNKHQRYEAYVKQIDTFPDNHFFVVLIDGRSRAACIKHAINKVSIGGYIVLDNAERKYYTQNTAALLANFERKVFAGCMPCNPQFAETHIYRKNA